MDEFIRQLTHNKEEFESQWPDIFTKLQKFTNDIPETDKQNFKVKGLDGLVDYILADHEETADIKVTFIEITIKHFKDDPSPSLDELVRIFCRILDAPNTNNLLYLTFLEKLYLQFRLGEHLSKTPSVDLIDSFLNSLQKHQFIDEGLDEKIRKEWKRFLTDIVFSQHTSDTNRMNNEQTMTLMRTSFQQLYRWAARNSDQSTVWFNVVQNLSRTLPALFDSFTSSNDAQDHIAASVEGRAASDYVNLISKSCQQQVEVFTANELHIYTAMEKLVLQNKIKEAEYLIRNVIVIHFKSITHMEELLHTIMRLCSSVNIESRDIFCKEIISPICYAISNKKFNKKIATLLFDFILAILDLTVVAAPACACRIIKKEDFYPWKQLDQQLTHLVQSCSAYDKVLITSHFSDMDELEDILKFIHERARNNTAIFRATHEPALRAVFKWSGIINPDTGKPYIRHVLNMAEEMTKLIDWKQITIELCSRFLEILQKRIDNEDETADLEVGLNFLQSIAVLLSRCIEQLKVLPMTLHQQLAAYVLSAFNCPLKTECGSMTFAQTSAMIIWFKIPPIIDNEDNARVYESCLNRLFQLIYDEDEESVHTWWSFFWSVVTMKYPNVAADHISQFLTEVIDHKRMDLIALLPSLYPKRSEAFHTRLNDLIHSLFDDDSRYLGCFYSILDVIFKTHPELITAAQIDYLLTSMNISTGVVNQTKLLFNVLGYVAAAQPSLFDKHRGQLLSCITEQQTYEVFNCLQQYLVASTILNGEKTADEYLTLLINLVKNIANISPELSTQIFRTCQLIGVRHKQILANKRNELLPFEANSACRMLIDFIDGSKMSEENQASINRTLDEVARIEQRVVHTERDVQTITKTVKRQELNITNLGTRVNTVDTRMNDIAEQVDLHAREIERIDAKTLSYVPSEWGRDVCTLLNVRANNDWRLLGKRFGYSTSELKHWAMQRDPSMSLLNEWFMTHKADEATYGLVKMLSEIGRKDVEEIIRKAVQAAGELIPDDLPMEIKRLPPVFLSYQWGSQKAVMKLKANLEQAGYACWMDTGQMGGGDKLFAKIDAGIRGAKVVICCINAAYAQSDNCSREVHLTISTGKPLIPLQMEKLGWPPEGALGPIMSEYLYIRFYDRKANDENYWPADRFTELLGQIRYHVAPDPDMITGQYHNWFVPRVDNLIFLQPTPDGNKEKPTPTVNDNTPLVVTHPQIMISYQWDYQNDIVILYKKLTQLGYRCWLDIFQMGGGDSLFEKIDTGIRHAKCIISCVTPKYTKSINCRREMALSDALQKPIAPLLLEETSTWPPAGPMAMVFAEKPYIDFRQVKDDSDRWIGKEFELVLAKLKQTVPEVQTEKPQRHLLDMQRPTTAVKREETRPKRIGSAPIIPESRACSIM